MTSQALQLLFQEELARLHLAAEHLLVTTSENDQWHASLHVHRRAFELGSSHHGGFYCRQLTACGPFNYVPREAGPLFGQPGLLVRSGLLLISAGINDPEAATAGPPVI